MVHRSFVVMAIVACAAIVGIFAGAWEPEVRAVLAGNDPVVIDDFDDGSLSSVWQQTSWGTGPSVREANGRLEYTVPADSKDDPVQAGFLIQHTHMCKLSGDFVVEADFNLTAWPEENGTRMALAVGPLAVLRATDAIWGNVYNAVQTGTTLTWFDTSDTSGRMRISREGDIFTGSFNSTGNWQTLASVADTEDDVTPRFQVWAGEDLSDLRPEESRDEDTIVTFDNLTLVSGTLTCGEKVEFTQAIQVLQDVSDLVNDLEKEKSPPVPIVADKPMAVRVYFDEVNQSVMRKVALAGEVEREQTVTLTPGCDIEKQREQKDGCQSADFYFTPPEGEWAVMVSIRDGNGGLLSHGEFTIESVDPDSLVLNAVSVCDSASAGHWRCGSPYRLDILALWLKRAAPTAELRVNQSGHVVRRLMSDYGTPREWWSQVVLDIENLHSVWDTALQLLGQQRYYFGMVHEDVPGLLGKASGIPGRGGAAKTRTSTLGVDDSHLTTAHEIGHMLGAEHTNKPGPGGGYPGCYANAPDSDTDWVYGDNKIQSGPAADPQIEVGFDLATKTALDGEKFFELMGYCNPQWVSPRTYLIMLNALGVPVPVFNVLGVPPEEAFWLVTGEIAEGETTLRALFEVQATADSSAGEGSHRIEVRDASSDVLFSRAFAPIKVSARLGPGQEDTPSEVFSETIPIQQGAARIVVLDDSQTEIGAIELTGVAPSVDVTSISNTGDAVQVSWSVDDPDSAEHTYWVDYSPDGGETWFNQGMSLTDPGLALPVETLAGSDHAVVRVLASDGANTGAAISEPFSVPKKLPQAEILFPENGRTFDPGDLVWLQAFAFDPDDVNADDASIEWTSSRDGLLGTGDDLPVYDLSEGVHAITLTVRDSDGNEATDSITVVVGEGGLKGDVDCDGDVDTVDALKRLQHMAGLPAGQEPGCPEIGSGDPQFGDVDCDGDLDSVDSLLVLRHVAALPVSLPPGCPEIGARKRRGERTSGERVTSSPVD